MLLSSAVDHAIMFVIDTELKTPAMMMMMMMMMMINDLLCAVATDFLPVPPGPGPGSHSILQTCHSKLGQFIQESHAVTGRSAQCQRKFCYLTNFTTSP